MKSKKLLFLFSLVAIFAMTAFGQDQYRSLATGNWNATATWEKSTDGGGTWGTAATVPGNAATDIVLIRDSHTVTFNVDTTVISSLTIGEGTSGILKYESVTTPFRILNVTGNITLINNAQFIHGLSVNVIHRLYIGGNLSLGNSSILSFYNSSSRGVSICFNKAAAGDQTITTSGIPTTADFQIIIINRGSPSYRVLSNINMNIKGGNNGFQLLNGIYEQSSGHLVLPSGLSGAGALWNNDSPNGTLKITGNANVLFSSGIAGASGQKGTIIFNTSDSITIGSPLTTASGSTKVDNAGTLNIISGTITIFGRFVTSTGTTTISGGNIFLDPQSTSVLPATNNTFEVSTTGTLNMSAGSVTLVDPISVTGTGIDIKMSGTVNFSGGTINIGDGVSTSAGSADGFEVYWGSGKTLNNLVINNPSGTNRYVVLTDHTTYKNLILTGNLNIIAGELRASAPDASSANISIAGNWTNTGTFTPGTSTTVTFSGSSLQQYKDNGTLKNVTLNNPAGLTLISPMNISGVLTLTSGLLTSTSSNLLTLGAAATVAGGSNTSFVNGPCALTARITVPMVAPIGKGSAYRPLTSVMNTLTGSGTLTAEQFETSPSGILTASGVDGISNVRYFRVDKSSGITGGDANLTLSWGDDDNVADPTSITVCGQADGGNWNYQNHDGGYTLTATGGYVTTGSFDASNATGNFALGNLTGGGNPLPVSLSSFSASPSNGAIKLNWKTSVETGNHGFDIERSSDKSVWATLTFIQGQGNSNSSKAYFYSDNSIKKAGKYYYRLKQIDNNGGYKYSNIVEADFILPAVYALNQNYPNPFNPNTLISYSLPLASNVKISVYNAIGETVQILENGFKNAGNYSVTFNAATMPSGIYFYRIEAGKFSQVRKMMLLK